MMIPRSTGSFARAACDLQQRLITVTACSEPFQRTSSDDEEDLGPDDDGYMQVGNTSVTNPMTDSHYL
jgi:hypothetical protein